LWCSCAEFETIDEGGFIFKIRRSRLEEIAAAAETPLALKGGEPHEDSEPVAEDQSFEDEKKRKRLLTLQAM